MSPPILKAVTSGGFTGLSKFNLSGSGGEHAGHAADGCGRPPHMAERRTNMISVGGAEFYPSEIEAAFEELSAVRRFASCARWPLSWARANR